MVSAGLIETWVLIVWAISYNDSSSYGWLFQWGRGVDGHQIRTSGTTAALSSSDDPGHANFIMVGSGNPKDWRNPQNDQLWQGVTGINNPCPLNFRVPTHEEWANLKSAAGITTHTTAFSSTLKLPAAGSRFYPNASMSGVGTNGNYASSTINDVLADYFLFSFFLLRRFSRSSSYGIIGTLYIKCSSINHNPKTPTPQK